ncbi:MAG: restriction endonuclease [Limisphaerales bacterium]|nr:MAG: restriction endonuclease [Limisphaerales bacterium]KAG0509134.1 MAG: restriction endonuclease [Limisphaerales bacterium]TXT50841.1 MAG: restriction endonuclease [Limisphaerales bacterium]
MSVSAADKRLVRERAGGRCEYCRMAETWEPFFSYHVEHIIARQHNGSDSADNLCLACHHCNAFKGPNLTSVDPDGQGVTKLFNPRAQTWTEHFRIESGRLIGLTPEGRTTVFLLQMNAAHRVELRLENMTN